MKIENLNLRSNLQKFLEVFMKTLYKFSPQKNKYSRGNNMPFMCKLPSPAHMKRIPLINCYILKHSGQKRPSYAKRHNYCVLFLEKPNKIIMQT